MWSGCLDSSPPRHSPPGPPLPSLGWLKWGPCSQRPQEDGRGCAVLEFGAGQAPSDPPTPPAAALSKPSRGYSSSDRDRDGGAMWRSLPTRKAVFLTHFGRSNPS